MVAFVVAGTRLQVSPRVFVDMLDLDMFKIPPAQLPYLVWLHNDVRGLENMSTDSSLVSAPYVHAQNTKQTLVQVLNEAFGVAGTEEAKAEISLKHVVGKIDIVASLKDRMNVVHFFRNFSKYDTMTAFGEAIQEARNQLVKRFEMEIDCFFHEMAIKAKKQCRVIRNDLKDNLLFSQRDPFERLDCY